MRLLIIHSKMIRRISENLLLRPEDFKPLRDDFAVIGVFNPGAVQINDEIVLLVRVAERPLERRPGYVGLPRRGPDGNVVVDWVSEEELDRADPRIVRRKADICLRLTSISHLRVFRSRDGGSTDWAPGPIVLAGVAHGGIWHRRSTDHGDRWKILDHLRRRVAARGGDGAGFHQSTG